MKKWDIDSVKCRNSYFKNVRNFNKSSTSETVVSPGKGDTRSQSTKKKLSLVANPSNLQTSASDNSTKHADSPTIQKKQSQSPQIQSFLSSTTDSNILKSMRTYYQRNNIPSAKACGKLDSGTEELPKNVYSDDENYSKNYQEVHSNEIDSFNPINGNGNEEDDDIRYSLYYSPDDRCSDDEKVDTFDNKNSYLCPSSNEIEHSTKELTISKIVHDNGYQRTRKNMKKHLAKQKKIVSISDDPKVKMANSDNPLTKSNVVAKKQIFTGDLTISKEVTSNGFQRTRKNLKNHNVVKQNTLESETDALKVMIQHPDKRFNNNCVFEEEKNSTSDISSTDSKMPITNFDSKGAYAASKKVSNNGLPNRNNEKSLHLVEKMLNKSHSKCNSHKATVPNFSSTSNKANTVKENTISSSGLCKKIQTKNNVSDEKLLVKMLKVFSQSQNNVSDVCDLQENSLNETEMSNSYDPQENSKKSENSQICDPPKFFVERLVLTGNDQSNNPLSKSSENKRSLPCDMDLSNIKRSQGYLKTNLYSAMTDVSGNEETQNCVRKPTISTASTQSLNSTQKRDSCCASKKVHACSKFKLVSLPVMVYDSDEEQPSNSDNPFLPVLTAQVNKLSSTILMMVKRDSNIVHSISSDHLKSFYDSVERLSELSEIETATELVYRNPPVSMSEDNDKNDLYEQFTNNAFNSHKECPYEMLKALLSELDACDLLFKVRQFCTSPKVVQCMETIFDSFDEFPLSSSIGEIKFQFQFPNNLEDQSFHAVVKDYVRLFAHKIWPKEAETIKGQYVIEFAQQNLSTVEIFIVSSFFKKCELLTKQTFIARFTYVAILSVYKFYITIRMSDE